MIPFFYIALLLLHLRMLNLRQVLQDHLTNGTSSGDDTSTSADKYRSLNGHKLSNHSVSLTGTVSSVNGTLSGSASLSGGFSGENISLTGTSAHCTFRKSMSTSSAVSDSSRSDTDNSISRSESFVYEFEPAEKEKSLDCLEILSDSENVSPVKNILTTPERRTTPSTDVPSRRGLVPTGLYRYTASPGNLTPLRPPPPARRSLGLYMTHAPELSTPSRPPVTASSIVSPEAVVLQKSATMPLPQRQRTQRQLDTENAEGVDILEWNKAARNDFNIAMKDMFPCQLSIKELKSVEADYKKYRLFIKTHFNRGKWVCDGQPLKETAFLKAGSMVFYNRHLTSLRRERRPARLRGMGGSCPESTSSPTVSAQSGSEPATGPAVSMSIGSRSASFSSPVSAQSGQDHPAITKFAVGDTVRTLKKSLSSGSGVITQIKLPLVRVRTKEGQTFQWQIDDCRHISPVLEDCCSCLESCGLDCTNFIRGWECTPTTCLIDKCGNRLVGSHDLQDSVIVSECRVRGKGLGIFARKQFDPGAMIGAVDGTFVRVAPSNPSKHYTFMFGGSDLPEGKSGTVFYTAKGLGRHINSSCQPNCVIRLLQTAAGVLQVCIVATVCISADDEIVAGYSVATPFECLCDCCMKKQTARVGAMKRRLHDQQQHRGGKRGKRGKVACVPDSKCEKVALSPSAKDWVCVKAGWCDALFALFAL